MKIRVSVFFTSSVSQRKSRPNFSDTTFPYPRPFPLTYWVKLSSSPPPAVWCSLLGRTHLGWCILPVQAAFPCAILDCGSASHCHNTRLNYLFKSTPPSRCRENIDALFSVSCFCSVSYSNARAVCLRTCCSTGRLCSISCLTAYPLLMVCVCLVRISPRGPLRSRAVFE